MKMISKVALAAALVTGIGSTAFVAPAYAKKDKPAASAADSFNLSKEFRAPAVAAQTAIDAKDFATATTQLAAADALAKNDDERYIAATLRFKMIAGQPQTPTTTAALAGPIDSLLANPRSPKTDLARYHYIRGDIFYNLQQYPQALQHYTQARDGGLQDDELSYQIVRTNMESGNVAAGAKALEALVAAQPAGKKPPENWYRYAISRLYKANDTAGTEAWTARWLAAYGTKANWHDAIYTFGFQGPGIKRLTDRDRVDLYRLMSVTRSLAGQRDYIDYAQASIQIGLPTEGKSVIEEGRTNSAIPAANKTASDLLAQANTDIAGDKSFAVQEKTAAAAPKGDAASQTGDAYLGARNYAKAIAMYDLALTKGVANADIVH
ncbi:MAG: hypothetical protein ABI810_16025, partial [Sphingomonas bacterium]